MQERSAEQPGWIVPLGEDANRRLNHAAAEPLGLGVATIDANRQMAEMENVFRANGNFTRQMEALATLRRWQVDPRLDNASRQRASALVWEFQPNGWDEV